MHGSTAKAAVRPSLPPPCIGAPLGNSGNVRQQRHATPTCYAAAERCTLPPLEASRQLAALRAAEVHRAEPRFLDPLAEALTADAGTSCSAADCDADAAAIAFLDEQLLRGVDIVNMDVRQEYRQVVLLGCGMDTRPFRLGWPRGTLLFLLAPGEVHAAAERALRGVGAAVPSGCLLRRVPINLEGDVDDFGVTLEAAGYRGDRLSIWGLQGLTHLGLRPQQVSTLLAHAANMAALYSLFVGQLPPASEAQANEWLAQAGLLGQLVDPAAEHGTQPSAPAAGDGSATGSTGVALRHRVAESEAVPRLFSGQQQRLSLPQMRLYNSHVLAGEDTNEDFEGNFS